MTADDQTPSRSDEAGLREVAERHLDRRYPPPGSPDYREPDISAYEWREAYFALAAVAQKKLDECYARLASQPDRAEGLRAALEPLLSYLEAEYGKPHALTLQPSDDDYDMGDFLRDQTGAVRAALASPPDPGAGLDVAWLIWWEDPEHAPELFVGHGAEAGARRRMAEAEQAWNVTLFAAVDGIFVREARLAASQPSRDEG